MYSYAAGRRAHADAAHPLCATLCTMRAALLCSDGSQSMTRARFCQVALVLFFGARRSARMRARRGCCSSPTQHSRPRRTRPQPSGRRNMHISIRDQTCVATINHTYISYISICMHSYTLHVAPEDLILPTPSTPSLILSQHTEVRRPCTP